MTLAYPQLSQFPIRKQKRVRTVANRLADGRAIKLCDAAAAVTEWNLAYRDLTDQDAAALQQIFLAAEGTLNGFTFLDPAANLLAWSDKLDHPVWTRGPMLSVSGRHLVNGGGAPQSITQTLAAPPGYLYCLSAAVRAAQPCTVSLLVGAHRLTRPVTTAWARLAFAAEGAPVFGLELPAGAAIEVNGFQVEGQGGASTYKPSSTGGVYEDARFGDDVLAITATGVNRHAATVNIIHADHL
jgi:hypothetical protein